MPCVESKIVCEGELTLPPSETDIGEPSHLQAQNTSSNATSFSRIVSTVFASSSPDINGLNSPVEGPENNVSTEEEHYRISESSKPRVLWNFTHKVLLRAGDAETWYSTIKAGNLTALSALDLTRALRSQYNDSIDHNEQKYHGQIFVDLKPLLGKGVRSVIGRFKVSPCSDGTTSEPLYSKSDATYEMDSEEVVNHPDGDSLPLGEEPRESSPKQRGRGSKSPPKRERRAKKSGTENTEGQSTQDKVDGKKKRKNKGTEQSSGHGGAVSRLKMRGRRRREMEKLLQPEPFEETNPYDSAHTYVKLEISLAKPLVVKPPTPRNVLKPSDFIPKRAPLPHFFQVKEATEEYHAQIKQIVTELALEYRNLFGTQAHLLSQAEQKKFIFELNNKGQYFVIKEKLKKSVVRVVREKFQFVQNSPDQVEQLETFINELYVYLTEQMHVAMADTANGHVSPRGVFHAGQVAAVRDRLKDYADEAEILHKYLQAALCHQERVVHNKYNALLWYDYGCFALRIQDIAKAEECFHEAISLDSQHTQSLASYGIIMHEKGDTTKAEVFIRSAASMPPNNIPLSGLLGLLGYESEGKEVSRLSVQDSGPLYVQVAQYLLTAHFPKLAKWVLEQLPQLPQPEGTSSGRSLTKLMDPNLLQCWASVSIQTGEYSKAEEALEHLSIDGNNIQFWSMVGDLHYRQQHVNKAISAYKTVLDLLDTNPGDTSLTLPTMKLTALLRLGELCISAQNCEEAKAVFLDACAYSPSSPYAWLGAGVACYKMAKYDEAEDALAEANILNNHNAETWGYLTLLCFQTNRLHEANQAFKQALKLHLSDCTLLCDIGKCYLALQKKESINIAEQCFRTALKNSSNHFATSQINVLLENVIQTQHANM